MPDTDPEIREGGGGGGGGRRSSRPLDKGDGLIFLALRASVWPKNKG